MNLKLISVDDIPAGDLPDGENGDLSMVFRLDELTAWEDNPRRTGRDKGLDELCASIASHGLLQSLVVQMQPDGNPLVIAGERRLKALKRLAAEGRISPDALIPCRVAATDQDIAELALAENAVREPMHPADQFEAFMALVRNGTPRADIAARFGVSEHVVKQRMKLASLSAKVLDAYRAGQITLAQAEAFTINRDHVLQDEILAEAVEAKGGWNEEDFDPEGIRQYLTEKETTAEDPRVRYVTLAAYEEAGGTCSRDLFSADDKHILIDDNKLLDKLVSDRVTARLAELRAQGWDAAEYYKEFSYGTRSKFITLDEDDIDYLEISEAQEAELDRLQALYDELAMRWQKAEADSEEEAQLEAQRDAADDKEKAYKQALLAAGFKPEVKKLGKAVLTLDDDGSEKLYFVIERANKALLDQMLADGPENPGDQNDSGEDGDDNTGADDGDAQETPSPQPEIESVVLPHQLVETLTAHKSAAIAAELAQRNHLGLVCAVYALIREQLGANSDVDSAVNLETKDTGYPRRFDEDGTSKGYDALQSRLEELEARLPNNKSTNLDLWYWLLGSTEEGLKELLALCAALAVDTIVTKYAPNGGGVKHGNAIAQSLGLDMTKYFTPTADNYFNHVSKATILADLKEALGRDLEPAITKLKKAELALRAEREVAGTGWLPEPLRVPMPGEEA